MTGSAQDIVNAIERLISATTYSDFYIATADVADNGGFYIGVPAGGGTVIGTTAKGRAFNRTLEAGIYPVKLISFTFAGSVAGITIYTK